MHVSYSMQPYDTSIVQKHLNPSSPAILELGRHFSIYSRFYLVMLSRKLSKYAFWNSPLWWLLCIVVCCVMSKFPATAQPLTSELLCPQTKYWQENVKMSSFEAQSWEYRARAKVCPYIFNILDECVSVRVCLIYMHTSVLTEAV